MEDRVEKVVADMLIDKHGVKEVDCFIELGEESLLLTAEATLGNGEKKVITRKASPIMDGDISNIEKFCKELVDS